VVVINQKTFNQDMGRYIDNIRKKDSTTDVLSKLKFLGGSFSEKVPELAEGEVHVEYKEPSIFRRMMRWRRKYKLGEIEEELPEKEKEELDELEAEIEALEEEESALEEMEEEFEERRGSLLSVLMRKINIFKPKHRNDFDEEAFAAEFEQEAMQTGAVDEDVKDVLKIAHIWLERLPDRAKRAFKGSEDFHKYKTILMKYGLVKEKKMEEIPVVEIKEEVQEEAPKKEEKKKKVENKPKKKK